MSIPIRNNTQKIYIGKYRVFSWEKIVKDYDKGLYMKKYSLFPGMTCPAGYVKSGLKCISKFDMQISNLLVVGWTVILMMWGIMSDSGNSQRLLWLWFSWFGHILVQNNGFRKKMLDRRKNDDFLEISVTVKTSCNL